MLYWEEDAGFGKSLLVRWYRKPPSQRIDAILEKLSKKRVLRPDEINSIARKWCDRHVNEPGASAVYRCVSAEKHNGYAGYAAGKRISSSYAELGSEWIKICQILPVSVCCWCGVHLYAPHKKHHSHCKNKSCIDLNYFYVKSRLHLPKSIKDLPASPKRTKLVFQHYMIKFLERKSNEQHRKNKRRSEGCTV